MHKITVVCCYNNDDIFTSMLMDGLERQKLVEVEGFYYKNTFSCAALAYNDAIDKSNAEVIVFVHQDIKFCEDSFLNNLYELVIQNPNTVFGLCGSKEGPNGTVTYSNVFHGLQKKNIGYPIKDIINVDGLDEIFVAMHIELARKLRFDSRTVDGWHMYVENMCLDAKEQNINICVFPGKAIHKNDLEMPGYMKVYRLFPKEFFTYVKKVRNKHKGKSKKIVCPCISISTSTFKFYSVYYILKYKTSLKRFLRNISMK